MTKTAKAAVPSPQFKVGDYIAAHDTILMLVQAVLTDGPQPIYGISAPNDKASVVKWFTEWELSKACSKQFDIVVPDFDKYATLEIGDVVRVGSDQTQRDSYATVLARVGNLVLLSNSPRSQEDTDRIAQITDQLDQLTGGAITAHGDVKEELRKGGSMTFQSKIADKWWSTEALCLQNWAIVSKE